MNATAEQLDHYLREADPATAHTVEKIVGLLIQRFQASNSGQNGQNGKAGSSKRAEALAALNRIASRGGVACIEDASSWQQEQRTERVLPGRNS